MIYVRSKCNEPVTTCCTLPYTRRRSQVQLTILRLSDNQLYSRHTVWHGQSNQHCTKPLPLQHSALTRMVNWGHRAVHSPTHHRKHSHKSIGDAQWARKTPQCLNVGVSKNAPAPWNGTERNGTHITVEHSHTGYVLSHFVHANVSTGWKERTFTSTVLSTTGEFYFLSTL